MILITGCSHNSVLWPRSSQIPSEAALGPVSPNGRTIGFLSKSAFVEELRAPEPGTHSPSRTVWLFYRLKHVPMDVIQLSNRLLPLKPRLGGPSTEKPIPKLENPTDSPCMRGWLGPDFTGFCQLRAAEPATHSPIRAMRLF